MASASASVLASGFSTRTCLPAARAARAISACRKPGAQISTTWMSSRAMTARQSVADSAQPYRCAASATPSGSRPTRTRCSKAGTSKEAGHVAPGVRVGLAHECVPDHGYAERSRAGRGFLGAHGFLGRHSPALKRGGHGIPVLREGCGCGSGAFDVDRVERDREWHCLSSSLGYELPHTQARTTFVDRQAKVENSFPNFQNVTRRSARAITDS